MFSQFAVRERSSAKELEEQISLATNNIILQTLLDTIGGLFAICNEKRQIIAVNNRLLENLGLSDQTAILGLRPGEILGCKHTLKHGHECGAENICQSCGAAIAMVASLTESKPVEKKCAIRARRLDLEQDFFFQIRSAPVELDGTKLILLLIQDITRQQKLENLERTFFHDISNTIMALRGLSSFAIEGDSDDLPDVVKAIDQTSEKLANEVKFQRLLISNLEKCNKIDFKETDIKTIFSETVELISSHPATTGKKLRKTEIFANKTLYTDKTILLRVLQNMLLNAFENSDNGRAVRFWVDCGKNDVTFCVWNHQPIPEELQSRIFQRNYTSKSGEGHGIGTFSIKLLGEEFLGGKVYFETSKESGTVFRFCHPVSNG